MAATVAPLDEWLVRARAVNPNASDEDLTAYYEKKSTPAPSGPLPILDDWLPRAKQANPSANDDDLKAYWQEKYGARGAKEHDPGDVGRGFKTAMQQVPQTLYGLEAGVGAAGESAFGEGGVFTGIKEHGLKNYREKSDEIAKDAKPSDSITYAYEQAKEGNLGALADWMQYALGYSGGQVVQMLATAGVGSVVGKATLGTVAKTAAEGLVAKETARLAATTEGAALAGEELTKLATRNVAAKIGQTAAMGATAVGMEGGEIFGGATDQATKDGRTLSGEEIAKAFGATLAAGSLEFVGDKLGLDIILGKSPLGKVASTAPGATGRVLRGGVQAGAAAPIEGATEYAQTLLEKVGQGQDPFSDAATREAIDSAALGAAGGTAIGAGSGLMSAAQPKPVEAPATETAAADPIHIPDVIGVGQPGVGIDQAIARMFKLVEAPTDTAKRAAATEAARMNIEAGNRLPTAQEAATLGLAEPRQSTGDIPILPGADAAGADPLIQVVSPPKPKEAFPADPREAIAQERERLLQMKAGQVSNNPDDVANPVEPSPPATTPTEPTPLQTSADLAYPAEERGRIPSQQDLLLRTKRTAPRSAYETPIVEPNATPVPTPVIEPGTAFTPKTLPQPSPRERIAQERARILAMKTLTPQDTQAKAQAAGSTLPPTTLSNVSGRATSPVPSQQGTPELATSSATPPQVGTTAAQTPETAVSPIDQEAHAAAPSPENDLPEPTEAQKHAGNYRKGHLRISGMDISVENPQGSERSGTDKGGKPWSITMQHHYGYFRGTVGKDKDHIDVFIKPGTPDDYSGHVFVVDQKEPSTGKFDEHKTVIGATTKEEARAIYLSNYAKDWQGLRSIKQFTMPEFKVWLKVGNKQKPVMPFAEKVKAAAEPTPVTSHPAAQSDAVTSPRSELPDQQNAEMLLRAEKAKAELESGGETTDAPSLIEFLKKHGGLQDQGGELSHMGVDADLPRFTRKLIQKDGMLLDHAAELAHEAGLIPERDLDLLLAAIDREARGLDKTAGSWYDEATSGPMKLSKERVERAIAKIIRDHGDDVGKDVARVKELLLQDPEFRSSPWQPKTDQEWADAIAMAKAKPEPTEKAKAVQAEKDKLEQMRPAKDGQQEIAVPPPTIGQKPNIKAEAPVGETPLFSQQAQTAEPEQTDITETPEAAPSSADTEAAVQVATWVKNRLRLQTQMTRDMLTQEAERAFGKTRAQGLDVKQVFDALELGVNQYIADQPAFDPDYRDVAKAQAALVRLRSEILDKIPSQMGVRSQEMQEYQQFSTPPDLAYTMAWAGNIGLHDTVVEPSAGLGGLAVFAKKAGATVIVNEYSARRRALLEHMGFDRVLGENAEQLDNVLPDDVKPTVILMNPPFSTTAGRMEGTKSSTNILLHIGQALERLAPGGRAVVLIGEAKPEMNRRPSEALLRGLDKFAKQYTLQASIAISGKGYAKYGTTYDNRILIYDKITPSPDHRVVTGRVEDVRDALPLLKEVRDARRQSDRAESTPAESNRPALAEASQGGGRPDQAVSAATPVVGSGGKRPEVSRPTGSGVRPEGATPASDVGSAERPGPAESGGVRPAGREPAVAESGTGGDTGGRSESSAGRPGESPGQRPESGSQPADRLALEASADNPDGPVAELTDSIFETYHPKKARIAGAKSHPGKLVESAAMSAVDPPHATYQPSLPKAIITKGKVSDAQLEVVIYAGQAHEAMLPNGQRKGFFVGDGTGVGKGREIAATILDNFQQGRTKAVWITKNSKLMRSAVRDWTDIGGSKDDLFDAGKLKLDADIAKSRGIAFGTYGLLRTGIMLAPSGKLEKSTKVNKQGKTARQSRIDQLVQWLGKDFDGVIVFDEAHLMRKNTESKGSRGRTKPSIQALAGLELQTLLPKARILYASATGGIEVSDFGYAERLGMWGQGTPFANKQAFNGAIESGGLAAMEVVSQDLKANGLYVSRSLSYDEVTYERLQHDLTDNQKELFNTMARGWQSVLQNLHAALEATGVEAPAGSGGKTNGQAKSAAMSKFWGAHQRFFNQILTALQMPSVLKRIKSDVEQGEAVVIQLVNTNEATQDRQIDKIQQDEGSLDDLDLTPRENLMQYIERSFPTQQFEEYMDENGNVRSRPVVDSKGNPVQNKLALKLKRDLLEQLGSLKVPDGPLEYLLNTFGEGQVAEVTGRGQRVVRTKDGETVIQKRSESIAAKDAEAFMDDKKPILVFSDAGGTGESYHADKTKKNQRKRNHYVIQPGWRADSAMQGLGRTHRTNQKQAPHYMLVSTDLNGHRRFISTIARRLSQLGALTKGQRNTSSQGLFSEKDNLENAYARGAVYSFLKDLHRGQIPDMSWADLTKKLGFESLLDDAGAINDEKIPSVPQFLNRLLSLEYAEQNAVFDQFYDRMSKAVDNAVARGEYETGLENYKADSVKVRKAQTVYTDKDSGATVRLIDFEVHNKVQFRSPSAMQHDKSFVSFVTNNQTGKVFAAFRAQTKTDDDGKVSAQMRLWGPQHGTGLYVDTEAFAKRYTRVDEQEGVEKWKAFIKAAPQLTDETVHLIEGALLKVWDRLPPGTSRVYRIQTDDGKRFVGRAVAEEDLASTLERFGVSGEQKTYTPEDVADRILDQGATAELTNGWKLKRSKVGGEDRIELTGRDSYNYRNEFKEQGLFAEVIQYQTRWFVPVDQAAAVIGRLTEHRPVMKVSKKNTVEGLANAQEAHKAVFDDPSADEADTVQSGIDGKSALEATLWLAQNAPSADTRLIASRIVEQMQALQLAGMTFEMHLAHIGDQVPTALMGARGLTARKFNSNTTHVWINGADVEGKVGVSYETVLHELLHAVTQTAVHVGNLRVAKGGPLAASVKDLYDVTNAIIDHFKTRVREAKNDVSQLTPFETSVYRGGSNALRNPDEVLAWALSNREMQAYLETIPYKGQTLWGKFVSAVRRLLGLDAKAETALSEVLRIADDLLSTPANQLLAMAESSGVFPTAVQQPATAGLVNEQTAHQAGDAFQRWFGESQIINADGSPKVLYHGTSDEVEAFDFNHPNRKDTGWLGTGVYMTDSPSIASSYANMKGGRSYPNVMPLYAKVLNPYRATQRDKQRLQLISHRQGLEAGRAAADAWTEELKDQGYDGVILEYRAEEVGDHASTEVVAFNPSQVKSATGNRGTYDEKSGLINQQIATTNEDQGITFEELTSPTFVGIRGRQTSILTEQGALSYELPPMSRMDDVTRIMQDKNIDLVRLVDAIKAAGREVPDELNPVLKEEMYMGRTSQRLQDFLNSEMKPLVDAMRLNKVTMSQLEQYLHARHAKEANAYLAEINPDREDNEALSGMTDEEAERILGEADRPKMDRLAARVDAILANTRRLMVDYGLESQERVNSWMDRYNFYVPLHRSGFEDGPMGTGQGRSIRGSSVKNRTGSTLSVTNILANVALDREKAIVRGEKMRPVVALAGLLMKNPNDEIATLAKPAPITYTDPETGLLTEAPGDIGEYRVPMIKIMGQDGTVRHIPDPQYKGRDNVVNFRIDGRDYALVFNEKNPRALQIAHSLKDLDVGQLNTVMSGMARVTRYLAAVNTQYNPAFGVVNFVRDVQFVMLSLSNTPLAGQRSKVLASTWRALRGIYQDARAVRRGERPSSSTAELWERFQKVGGPTGYRDMFRSSNDRADAIQHMLDPDWWQKTLGGKVLTAGGVLSAPEKLLLDKAGKPLFAWLSDYNTAMENAVRLGVFKAGLDQGMTDIQAASFAKNASVNFNKKGQISAQMGALYAFFNASVQGTARIAETLFEKGKFGTLSAVGKKIIAGGVTLGAMQTFLLAMAGFGEDDPPDWLRSRSLIIPVPGTEKGYVSIPMPLGFNVIPNVGRLAAETVLYGKPLDRSYRMMGALLDAFSPVGGAATAAQFIAPTVTDPLIALSENKDWTGRKIFREDFNSLKPTPGFTRTKDTATPWARGLAEVINYATGGSDYTPGILSPTPDSIDYLVAQATGGVGREASKIAQTTSALTTGSELPIYKVPVAGRFAGSAAGQSHTHDEFYRNLRELNIQEAEVKGRRLDGKDAAEFVKDHPEARLARFAEHTERDISNLNRRKRELSKRGASPEQVRAIDEQITARMERLNRRVRELATQ